MTRGLNRDERVLLKAPLVYQEVWSTDQSCSVSLISGLSLVGATFIIQLWICHLIISSSLNMDRPNGAIYEVTNQESTAACAFAVVAMLCLECNRLCKRMITLIWHCAVMPKISCHPAAEVVARCIWMLVS
jgi:hypothetical protein